MKRPLATVGFTYIAVCALAAGLPARVCLALAVAAGIFGALALLSRHKTRRLAACVLFAASCACTALLLADAYSLAPARALTGSTLELSGTVEDVKSAQSIVVKSDEGISVAVSSREPLDVRVGEHFSALVTCSLYGDGDDTAGAAARARQTPLSAFVLGEYRVQPPEAGTLAAVLYNERGRFEDVLFARFSRENAGLMAAMLLGERQLVPEAASDVWYGSGIGHLLAISGYHVTLLTALMLAALRITRLPKRVQLLLTGGAVLFYMALVGFSASVTRAGIMALLVLLASVLGREADALTSLAAAGLIICVYSPYAASGASFSLSFVATLGLILFSTPLQKWMEERLGPARFPRARSFFVSALAAGLCGYGATFPIALLTFERIPLYGPVTNLLIAPLVPVAIACGLLAMLVGAIPVAGVLAVPLAAVSSAACTLMTEVARLIAGLPFAQPPAGAGFLTLWMAGAAILIAAAAIHPCRKKTQACAVLCMVTLMAGVLSYQLMLRGAVHLSVVSTTSSAAFVAVKDGRAAIVGDVRTRADVYAVRRVLERGNVRAVELVALAPMKNERPGAVSALLLEYSVQTAVLCEEDRADERMKLALAGTDVYAWETTEELSLLGGERVRLSSDGVFAEFAGIKAFILTEDCDILNSIVHEGMPAVAVLGPQRPADANRLASRWLVDCGGSGAGLIAEDTVSAPSGEAVDFLLKNGRARLVD